MLTSIEEKRLQYLLDYHRNLSIQYTSNRILDEAARQQLIKVESEIEKLLGLEEEK
jgi:hypothetical protein